jgi:hypothetical protein
MFLCTLYVSSYYVTTQQMSMQRHILSIKLITTPANTTTWSYNEVRELIAVKVLHTSLLNTTVVAFEVLPFGSYAPMPAPSPPFKTVLELVL